MDSTLLLGIIAVVLTLLFSFSNGFNDSACVVATQISSRALSPYKAIFIAAVFEFIGACFLGTSVAKTIGTGIIDPQLVAGTKLGIFIIFATLIGSTLWNVLCTILGLPISASHSLIGGFVGSAVFGLGFSSVQWINIIRISGVLIVSPIIGMIAGYSFTKVTYYMSANATLRINKLFKLLQVFSSSLLALAHGTNDAQKSMGIIVFSLATLGLYSSSNLNQMVIPMWVILSCAGAMTLGILCGGWNVIKTIGSKIYKVRPIHGFCTQTSSAIVIYLSTILGFPVSTTHIVASSVMGSGSAERPKAVRWGLISNIFIIWVITIPASALISGIIYILIKYIFQTFII